MAEKEPPGESKPNSEGQGTVGPQPDQLPTFTPDVDLGAQRHQGPQRLKPQPPLEPSEQSPEPVPPRLDLFFPPPSEYIDSTPPSPIVQAPPPERRIKGIGWGQGTNPNPSTESADTYRERVAPENRPSEWWKSFDLPKAPDEEPDK